MPTLLKSHKKEFGDYQTPPDFALKICQYLKSISCETPEILLEPTCGVGNFLHAAASLFPSAQLYGMDINADHLDIARHKLSATNAKLVQANAFDHDYTSILKGHNNKASVWIIGNPPWANSSTLNGMGSHNQPHKSNIKSSRGLDAITGTSNFDICEHIVLRLIDAFKRCNATLALLCKTSVARSIFREMHRQQIGASFAQIVKFNAQDIFGVAVDACLFVTKFSPNDNRQKECHILDIDNLAQKQNPCGFIDDKFYSNIHSKNAHIYDGHCCMKWRQGVKHDCAKIMEFTERDNLYNGLDEIVDIEGDFVFPLLKSSHIKSPIISAFSHKVIVTQRKIKESTTPIEHAAPKTWRYLQQHKISFEKRKSSIYKNSPPFSMFGVGEYSYAPHKVVISGFYKTPLFSYVAHDKKPVMLDDTCYFLSFNNASIAYTMMLMLNTHQVRDFLSIITQTDAKRPFTKKLLSRLDLKKCITNIPVESLIEVEHRYEIPHVVTNEMREQLESHILHLSPLL